LKDDGSITAWGQGYSGGSGAPTDSGYTQIFSNNNAFSALKSDGSITVWGNPEFSGGAPTDDGYTQIVSNGYAFAALKPSLVGNTNDAPTGSVTISGLPVEGEVLMASNNLADEDGLGEISYRWNRNGKPVSNTTSSTYTLNQDDLGTGITVRAFYTDGFGRYESVMSESFNVMIDVFGDASRDGVVDVSDLGILGANFNKANAQWMHGDFNGDGFVDVADLGIIGANWGEGNIALGSLFYASSEMRTALFRSHCDFEHQDSIDFTALLHKNYDQDLILMLIAHQQKLELDLGAQVPCWT